MNGIIKPTAWLRTTLNQEAAVVVPPDPTLRRVTIVVPSSPTTGFLIDASPMDVGFNRFFMMAPVASATAPLQFMLAPGQWIIGCSQESLAYASVIIEYFNGANVQGSLEVLKLPEEKA